MKKKLLALLLCSALALGLTACGGSGDGSEHPVQDGSASSAETAEEVTITPDTVLLDEAGLKITAKELVDDSLWGPGVKLLIESTADRSLTVQCNSLVVNGYMMSDLLFSADVAAGKKANETLYFSSSDLEAAEIQTISEIDISFHVFDSESYDAVLDSSEVSLQTSAYGTVEQPALDDGKELYNANGVRIVGRYVDEDSFWGAGLLLFMENTSDRRVTIQCDDLSINGFMVTPLFSCDVNAGRMALDEISVLSSDLEENGIEAVEEVELTFSILDLESFSTIDESGPITFTVG